MRVSSQKFFFYRGVEKWYLARLITLRPSVRFRPPQPIKLLNKSV